MGIKLIGKVWGGSDAAKVWGFPTTKETEELWIYLLYLNLTGFQNLTVISSS